MRRLRLLVFILLITLGFALPAAQPFGKAQNTAVFLPKPTPFQMVPTPYALKKPRILLADRGGAIAALRFVT